MALAVIIKLEFYNLAQIQFPLHASDIIDSGCPVSDKYFILFIRISLNNFPF